MRIFFDAEGDVNFDQVDEKTTVTDMLAAVDAFLESNPLACFECEDSCCKKPWSVGFDNICVNKICNWDHENAVTFVKDNLIRKMNYARDFTQLVLNKDMECTFVDSTNRCLIYDDRPVICRLYLCCKMSQRYKILREMVASMYLKALVLEYRMHTNDFTVRTIKKYRRNPAVCAKGYDITLDEILNYAEDEGWLEEDEKQLLAN